MSGSVAAVPSYFHRTKAWSCQNPVSHLERRERGLIAPPPQTPTPTSLHRHPTTSPPPSDPIFLLCWLGSKEGIFILVSLLEVKVLWDVESEETLPPPYPPIPKFSTLPSSLSGMVSGVFYVFLRIIGSELRGGGSDRRSEALSTSKKFLQTISVFDINLDQI